MNVGYLDISFSKPVDEVYNAHYCSIGDIVKISLKSKKGIDQPHGFIPPTKARVQAIYPTFIRFYNGVYNFCLDKTDFYTGRYMLKVVTK